LEAVGGICQEAHPKAGIVLWVYAVATMI